MRDKPKYSEEERPNRIKKELYLWYTHPIEG